ncbi:MAG: hypothetical protein RBS58_07240 [Syntrophales bacterium]|jgi:hypothetical protein|nr:hypothetical protein [Syntrophales bacterium]MDX9922424.1 hypothetical protein [Syntrophales bacterium]
MAAIVYQTSRHTGITYAYESLSCWDREKKQSRAKRKCTGRVDPETKEIIPTRKRMVADDPGNHDTVHKRGPVPLENVSETFKNYRFCHFDLSPVTSNACEKPQRSLALLGTWISRRYAPRNDKMQRSLSRSFYGATYLFDAIGEKLGITADLRKCFPGTYKQTLSTTYYLIMEDRNPLSRFSKWAATHKHPYGKHMPSQRSSELFVSISEGGKNRFFRLQGKRRGENEY